MKVLNLRTMQQLNLDDIEINISVLNKLSLKFNWCLKWEQEGDIFSGYVNNTLVYKVYIGDYHDSFRKRGTTLSYAS